MLTQEESIITSSYPYCKKRICWKSIFAGALVGFGLTFLLKIFDKAIGITVYSVNSSGAEAMVLGGFLGSVVGIIASMFLSGWVASYLSRPYFFDRRIGALYGLLVWCLTLLISLFFMLHLGFHAVGSRDASENPNAEVIGMNTSQTALVIVSKTDQGTAMGSTPVKKIGVSLLLTFILFFIGAVSACFGGYFGLKDERKAEPPLEPQKI